MTGRVLLLRALGLGDFLTGVPAYRAVRRAFPRHQIVLAAPAGLAGLVPATGAIDELLPAAELEPVAWPGPPPDVAVDLHGRGPASHRLLAVLQPHRLITFGGRHGGGFAGPPWRPGEHEVARWCRLCSESGIPADPADLRLTPVPEPPGSDPPGLVPPGPAPTSPNPAVPDPAGLPPLVAALSLGGAGVTIVHAGAAAPSRRWPRDRFAAVARELARGGHHIVLTGSAAERPLALDVARRAGLPPWSVLAGRTSLAGLAALTAAARLVVSGDTGLAHLASAYVRPSVVLFGPVPPAEWGPPAHPRHQVLWAGGDGYRGDPHGSSVDRALAAIPASAVLAAAERALSAGAQRVSRVAAGGRAQPATPRGQ
jgi:ADP-heptose:LPS heptosyltransferase